MKPSTQATSARQFVEAVTQLRKSKLDGLKMLRLTPKQAAIAADPCSEILIEGSNRASKTLVAAARFSSIARGIPIKTTDGKEVHCRLAHQNDRALLMWVIGDHLRHIGQTIYRVLFQPGLFRIVMDQDTGFYRAWNPVTFKDDWNIPRHLRLPSPPLIPGFDLEHNIDPSSDIADAAWYHASLHQFERVQFKNGTQIYAYANSSEVKQGDPVDEIWQDENMVYPEYYEEYVMRIVDNAGRMCWSSIPRDECPAYNGVHERAKNQQEECDREERAESEINTKVFNLTLAENPFISEEEKKKASERVTSERGHMIRILGKSSERFIAVYPEFNAKFHCVEYSGEFEHLNDKVTEALRKSNFRPPRGWTKEIIIDPGTVKPAVLFGMIPPPEFWDHAEPYLIIYDEIYIRRLDAFMIAAKIAEKEFNPVYHRMIIDEQMARQKPAGFSNTVAQQYSKAFETLGIQSAETGFSFIPGDPSFRQRSTLVRKALRDRPCGRPQLRIVADKCPETVKQLTRNTRKQDRQGNPLEEPADHQLDDLRECTEYWVSRHPKWVEPQNPGVDITDPGTRLFLQKMKEWEKESLEMAATKDNSVSIGISA